MMPQIILLAFYFISLGTILADHGREETKKRNKWRTIISLAIQLLLLWWGGFFDCFEL